MADGGASTLSQNETRRVTQAVQEVYRDVRATIPKPPRAWTRPPAPPASSRPRPPDFRGRPRSIPPAPDATDPESAYWRARQAARQAAIAQVQSLHQRGYSIRSIARQTGFARQTVDAWLQESVAHAAQQPTAPAPAMPPSSRERAGPSQLTGDLPGRLDLRGRPRAHQEAVESTDPAAHQWHMRQAARQAGIAQAHQLHRNGVSVRAIARQLHIARQTVDAWLHLPDPAETDPATGDATDPPSTSSDSGAARHDPCLSSSVPLTIPPPPAPWTSWEQVRQTRETLTEQHGLLLRRPDHLTSTDQTQLDTLLTSPAGVLLRVARAFVVDWYAIWRDERGARRSLADAQVRYDQWRTHPDYQAIPALHKVQTAVEQARFVQLSHFLKHPTWESTNNGAERGGRLFRQLQGPHFNLRTRDAIDAALKAHLQIAKELRTQASEPPPCRCGRGRKPGHVRRIVSV